MRKVYVYTTTETFDRNPTEEELLGTMGDQAYLELRNSFNAILGDALPERFWKGWDAMLLTQAPQDRVDRSIKDWTTL